VDALVYRGQIQLRRNDATGAVEALQKALKDIPTMPSPTFSWVPPLTAAQRRPGGIGVRDAVRLRPDLTDAQAL